MCFGRPAKHDQEENLNPRPVEIAKQKPAMDGPPKYAPPVGPPPNRQAEYAPPSGPPPSQHDWQSAVPDTSLLPPPPSLGDERSPTNNATEAEANNAVEWCKNRPLIAPLQVAGQEQVLRKLESGDIELYKPTMFSGELRHVRKGHWYGRSNRGSPDSSLMSTLPMYVVLAHSPLVTEISKTIYFEVKFLRGSRTEISLGLGFVAQPYPPFRLPGWERASLGVHGDDGHRYVNDMWGGKDFTTPFKRGETVGIGMTFSSRKLEQPPAYDQGSARTTASTPINVEVFFTRDGHKAGGWNIHEELDTESDRPVTGLEGMHDLYAAVGTFEAVEFEVHFLQSEWLYQP